MKPGATTLPDASMICSSSAARFGPISRIWPCWMRISAWRAGALVPSTTQPPLIRSPVIFATSRLQPVEPQAVAAENAVAACLGQAADLFLQQRQHIHLGIDMWVIAGPDQLV